ncbi:MAG: alpha/beta hydrolase [Spirochaetota bacterium]|nr:alpha/beta hydrolase [Spirochaetota bacterium]
MMHFHVKISRFVILLLFLSIISCGGKPYFMYYPNDKIVSVPSDIGLYYESVFFTTKDNVKLSGWWIPCNGDRGVVLFSHGNSGNISNRIDSIKIFYKLRLSIFIYDYRGYGRSNGSPSEDGTYLDAEAAMEYLTKKRKISQDRIIIFGRSLGGPIAAWLAQNYTSRMLIIESTFFSLADVAKLHYSWIPAQFIFGDSYRTYRYIMKVQCPVLIIHSRDDELVPYSQGKKLYELAKFPKELITIFGSHNYGFLESKKIYVSGIDRFISTHIH